MAAIVLTFDTARRRPSAGRSTAGAGEIVPFLGVRYQRLAPVEGLADTGETPADPVDGGGSTRRRC